VPEDLCYTLARQMGRLCPKFLGSHLLGLLFSFLWIGGIFYVLTSASMNLIVTSSYDNLVDLTFHVFSIVIVTMNGDLYIGIQRFRTWSVCCFHLEHRIIFRAEVRATKYANYTRYT
jgi:hypothetical protein